MNLILKFCLTLLVIFIPTSIYLQTQIGNTLSGDIGNSFFGSSVEISFNGKFIAVGQPHNAIYDVGGITVYKLIGESWEQIGDKLLGLDNKEYVGKNISFSSDGETIAIGAPNWPTSFAASRLGYVKIFNLQNNTWVQLGDEIIDPDNSFLGHQFGKSISLSNTGDRIAIGSPNTIGDSNLYGTVRIYDFIDNNWIQFEDSIIGSHINNQAGFSVSLSGDGKRIAVGSPGYDSAEGENIGIVRVYDISQSNFIPLDFEIFGLTEYEEFGSVLELSGDGNSLIIGNTTSQNKVRIFKYEESKWKLKGRIIRNYETGSKFGQSVSISFDGNRIAIGAPGEFFESNLQGSVSIYEWNGAVWQKNKVKFSGGEIHSRFGYAVQISANGKYLISGATRTNLNAGSAEVYSVEILTEMEKKNRDNTIIVYPNPVTDFLYLTYNNISNVKILIYDNLGHQMSSSSVDPKEMDFSSYPNGLYFIVAKFNGDTMKFKILKN